MENSVAIFGPAHVGKSTLAGYLLMKNDSDIDIDSFISKKRLELGTDYDSGQDLAYLVDKTKDEMRRGVNPNQGQTKITKYDRISIEKRNFWIIDTPGAQHRDRERIKGMYYGDTGLFVMETNKIIGKNFLDIKQHNIIMNYIRPLILWNEMRDNRRVILLLSKMDQCDYSETSFEEASSIIKTLVDNPNLLIIPYSIDVSTRTSKNVMIDDDKIEWYNGPTVLESLITSYDEMLSSIKEEKIFAYVDREDNVKGIGKVLRSKILKGTINKGDEVKILPIALQNSSDSMITAKIRGMKYEKGAFINYAESGSIVSLDLRDIRCDDKRIQKDEFCLTRATCIVDSEYNTITGNVVACEIEYGTSELFNILEEVRIIWFGRIIHARIICRKHQVKNDKLSLEIYNGNVSLPKEDACLLFNRFVLIRDDNTHSGCLVKEIAKPMVITWQLNKEDMLEPDAVEKYFGEFEYLLEECCIKFQCKETYIDVISRIRRVCERFGIKELEDCFEIENELL